MRKSLSLLFVALFSVGIFAQNAPINSTEYTIYNGQDYMPRLFEPYRADYEFQAKGLGLTFPLFEFSTNIVERKDSWSEEITFSLGPAIKEKVEDFPEAIYLTNEIDLKTGLLQRMTGEANVPHEGRERGLFEFGDNRLTFTGSLNGKVMETRNFPLGEEVYPCTMSFVFLSYLPLKDNFAGQFNCLNFDENDTPQLIKRRLSVVGNETVSTPAGTFDCFKLKDEATVEVKVNGKKKGSDYRDRFGIVKYFSGLQAYTWIDRKTRIAVRAELDFKKLGGKVRLELKKIRRNNSNL